MQSKVSWFQGVDEPTFKICEVKKLSNWLNNSSTEILRKNKQLGKYSLPTSWIVEEGG